MSERYVTTDAGPWFAVPLWVATEVSGGAVKVYAILGAKWANRDGECYPSQKVIAEESGCSVASAKRYLQELVDVGALEVHESFREDGSQRANVYQINTVRGNILNQPPQLTGERGGVHGCTTIEPEVLTLKELKGKEVVNTHGGKKIDTLTEDETFKEFWEAYRLHRPPGKQKALTAYRRAVKRDGAEAIRSGLAVWIDYWIAAKTEERFIPWASTFLNDGRYLDPPTTGKTVTPFTPEERERVLADARALSPEEISRRKREKQYPYDDATERRLGL